MSRLFDVYVAVDWSARNAPGPRRESRDSIWVAVKQGEGETVAHYKRTRFAAGEMLADLLRNAGTNRVLLGFDFGLGYPAGLADALVPGGGEPAWKRTWDWLATHVQDNEHNRNNRFEVADRANSLLGATRFGPFWGLPAKAKDWARLSRQRTRFDFPYPLENGKALERLRLTEKEVKGVQEVWKLYGYGSVGSQTLTGIPVLHRLRFERDPMAGGWKDVVRVWPFETGFRAPEAQVVFAEIYPSGLGKDPSPEPDRIPDRFQVRTAVERMAELDSKGELAPRFGPPEGLSAEEIAVCREEEGWILPLC